MPTTAPMLSLLHVFGLFHSQTICALLPGSLSQSCHFQYEQTHPDKNTIPKTFAQHYEPSKAFISYLFRNSFLRPLPRVPRHPRLDSLRGFCHYPGQLPHTAKLASAVHMFRNCALYSGTGCYWRKYYCSCILFSVLVSRSDACS